MIRSMLQSFTDKAETSQSRQLRVLLKIDTADDGSEYYRWRVENPQGKAIQQGSGALTQLSELFTDTEHQLWLLLPGQRVTIRSLEFGRRELRHLQHLIPYQLEEDLPDDTEKLHFAYRKSSAPTEDDRHKVAVAVVDKSWLALHLSAMAAVGLSVDYCVPEPLCLPEVSDGWTLRLNSELLVRSGTDSGFGVGLGVAQQALAMAAEQLPEPKTINLMADSESQLQRLMQLLPKSLRGRVDSLSCGHEWAFSQHIQLNPQLNPQLNLLQGEFAKRLPFMRWWHLWRWQLGLLAVMLISFSAANLLEVYNLQQQQRSLQSEIEKIYRQVMPDGVLVDAEKQLRRQYGLYHTEQQRSQLMPMLVDVLPLIAAAEHIDLKHLQYRDAEKSLRLNIEASSFQSIEALRSAFENKGLASTIIHANQRHDRNDQSQRHQARLQVSLL